MYISTLDAAYRVYLVIISRFCMLELVNLIATIRSSIQTPTHLSVDGDGGDPVFIVLMNIFDSSIFKSFLRSSSELMRETSTSTRERNHLKIKFGHPVNALVGFWRRPLPRFMSERQTKILSMASKCPLIWNKVVVGEVRVQGVRCTCSWRSSLYSRDTDGWHEMVNAGGQPGKMLGHCT